MTGRMRIINSALIALLVLMLSPVLSTAVSATDGQAASSSMLQFTSGGHVLGFLPGRAILAGLDHALTVEFPGGADPTPTGRAAGSAESASSAAPLGEVTYSGAWSGVDVRYTPFPGGVVESTYVVHPGGEVSDIRLKYNVPTELMADGSLRFAFETGFVAESAPIAWQEIVGERVAVPVHFVKHDQNEIGFAAKVYNSRYPLVIDPGRLLAESIATDMRIEYLAVGVAP